MEGWNRISGRPGGLLLAVAVRPGHDGWHITELRDEASLRYLKKYKTVAYGPGESEEWYSYAGEEPSSSPATH